MVTESESFVMAPLLPPTLSFSRMLPYLFQMIPVEDGDTYSGRWRAAALSKTAKNRRARCEAGCLASFAAAAASRDGSRVA
jgi:hypothetical protein